MGVEPYSSIPGWAVVTGVRDADPAEYNLEDAMAVVFDFAPDDVDARAGYLFPGAPDTGQRLTVGPGANPPRWWVHASGLVPGSRHRCVRRELLRGVSTPVVFEFPDLDTSAALSAPRPAHHNSPGEYPGSGTGGLGSP